MDKENIKEVERIGKFLTSFTHITQRLQSKSFTKEEVYVMYEDVISKYPKLDVSEIVIAFRNGSLGDYGRTFKLCTQELCIWIGIYLKDKRNGTIENGKPKPLRYKNPYQELGMTILNPPKND